MPSRITRLVKLHERWRGTECLNLIASENVTSPAVRRLLSMDVGLRYTSRDGFYGGSRYLDRIQRAAERLGREVFRAGYANVEPLSGHMADMMVLSRYTKPGDKILVVDPVSGGYPGVSGHGYPKVLGLSVLYFPFDREAMSIRVPEAEALIEAERPRLVVFGASFILFPHPVRELARVCQEVGCLVVYDGSHVLGLIGGGEFQEPLREGAAILMGSTHKSLFGPQGGLILAQGEHARELDDINEHYAFVDNAHWHRIAALAEALREMKSFGRRYAQQVVRNSRALAKALAEWGLPVVAKAYGYTSSHQVILDYGDAGRAKQVAQRLEAANIVVDRGIRLGVAEVTRRGMEEPEMERIAELIARVVIRREGPRRLRRETVRLVREFSRLRFCFERR